MYALQQLGSGKNIVWLVCYIILISVPDKPGQVNGLHSADQLCFSACDDGGNVLPHRCGGDRDGARGYTTVPSLWRRLTDGTRIYSSQRRHILAGTDRHPGLSGKSTFQVALPPSNIQKITIKTNQIE